MFFLLTLCDAIESNESDLYTVNLGDGMYAKQESVIATAAASWGKGIGDDAWEMGW